MKKILLIVLIGAAVYSYLNAGVMKSLLASADTAQVTSDSGIKTLRSVGGFGFDVNDLAVPGQVTVVEDQGVRPLEKVKRMIERVFEKK
ncbi:MAG: hypothetical protein OQK82_09255 [Candidatus Pacearchaeota archaeon]|nr:hypothetical protein [Candidatus Pacearchaeota archaeon]